MKKIALLFMLVFSTYILYAQTGPYKSGSLLWKISGKDLSNSSYLLGTFHFKSGEYLDSIPGASAALQICEQVIGEIPMSDMAGLQMKMMQAMMMTPDTTYKMLYSDDDYRFVNEQLLSIAGSGLDGQLGKMKPAAVQMTVIALAYMKFFPNINLTNTLDIRIQSEATKEQKPILGLETADDQIHVLFGILNLQRQADALLCGLKNMEESMALIPEIINIYDQGDLNEMIKYQDETDICPSTPEEKEALNKNRNNQWMQKLPEMMKEKSSFIAVGALHLAGEDGLLNLLEKAGYDVTSVKCSCEVN